MDDHDEEHPTRPGEPTGSERAKAVEEEKIGVDTTYEAVRREGVRELSRSTSALAWSGLAAGLAMGVSLVAQAVLHHHLPDAEWRPLVSKLGYSVGFLIVILGSQQLFTENTLTPIVPLLAHRTRAVLANVARLWAVVLAANLAGAFLFALVLARTALFEPGMHEAFTEIARKAMEPAPGTIVLRAVFAGWLIALLVWMRPAAKTAHVWIIVIVAWLIGVAHFSHVIVGAVEAFYLVMRGELGFGASLGGYVIPALVGNVAGGVGLAAMLNHAQVTAGGGRR